MSNSVVQNASERNFFDVSNIEKHFPLEKFREGQRECIEFAANAFNSGKRIVILECPTGSGKSPIGMTLADMVNSSYYLTITKILQDQLTNDFGDQIVELKGRNAYPCTFYQRVGPTLVKRGLWSQVQLDKSLDANHDCGKGFCKTNQGRKNGKCAHCFTKAGPYNDNKRSTGELNVLPPDTEYSSCPYYEQVFKAINSRKVTMNFSSFLFQTTMTRRFDVPRDLMVIDECHQVEPQLLDFVSLSINDVHLQKHGIYIPQFETAYEYAMWFRQVNIDIVLTEVLKKSIESEDMNLESEMGRLLKKYIMFMERVDNDGKNWVAEYSETTTKTGSSYRTITLKPVFVMDFAQSLLFGFAKNVLMMSATILDPGVFCKSLHLAPKDVAIYKMTNRFPVENRPIYIRPAAKMTGGPSKMNEWMPAMVKSVEKIAMERPNLKGIIHTQNYAILDGLLKKCNYNVANRFTTQREFPDKQELLKAHANRRGSIIVAPAMHEGIDLAGDLSRFQIICKVPYPSMHDDLRLAQRVDLDPRYYTWLVALKLVQSYGRSIRSETDYAETFIIDSAIYKFLKDAKSMLPTWFKEAIIDEGDGGK